MIRTLFFSPGKPIRTDISLTEFPRLLRDRKRLLWVDFMSEPPEIAEPILWHYARLANCDVLVDETQDVVVSWGIGK